MASTSRSIRSTTSSIPTTCTSASRSCGGASASTSRGRRSRGPEPERTAPRSRPRAERRLLLVGPREEPVGVPRIHLPRRGGDAPADLLVLRVLRALEELLRQQRDAQQVAQHEALVLLQVARADELVEVAVALEHAAGHPLRLHAHVLRRREL